MFPAFANALLLGGLAGITAPILIHLLLRRRSQKMRFSTVQFFIKKDEQSMRKRKLRNLLLLSLPRLWRGLTTGNAAEPGQEPATPQQRVKMGVAYVSLTALLLWLMAEAYIPRGEL